MKKLVLFCMILFAMLSRGQQQMMQPRSNSANWKQLKALLEQPNENKITFFVRLTNPALTKQNEQYVYFVARNFDYAGHIFFSVTSKYNLLPLNEEFHFVSIDISKNALSYMQERLSPNENQTLKEWIRKYAVFVMKMTNRGEVTLMQNPDSLHNHLMLNWIEKQIKIPMLKYVKQMTSYSDITVSCLNMIMLLLCFGCFVFGYRRGNFRMQQIAMLPICLFPSGHVYNQINGNDGGETTWLGISFSRHYNGQCLGESYFVFVLYVAFAFGMFNFIEFFKSAKATTDVKGQSMSAAQGRGRSKAKTKFNGDAKPLSNCNENTPVVYFSIALTALGFLFHSYLLKY